MHFYHSAHYWTRVLRSRPGYDLIMMSPPLTPSPARGNRSRHFDASTSTSESVEIEPESPSHDGPSTTFTTLRRITRSVTTTTNDSPADPLDLSSYAYASTPPRKRARASKGASTSTEVKIESSVSSVEPKVDGPMTPELVERPSLTPRSSSKKPMPKLALDKPHPAPAKWEEQYRLIDRMRKGIIAPVDDMPGERMRTDEDPEPKTLRFHTLISLMLSSQTKDAVTAQAVTNLHKALPGGLTAESLAAASAETIQECIAKVGFWRRKTEYIQDAAKKLLEREGDDRGDVPSTLEELCELRGVGPKMAFLCLQCAWDINAGIGVDIHVHRITNRLKWHKPPTNTPEQTRLNLQSWLPPELHKPINPMMVGFGQVICLPVGPRCDVCLLGQRKLCPSRSTKVNAEGRKEVKYTFTADEDEDGAKIEVKYEEEVEPVASGSDVPINGGVGLSEKGVLSILDRIDGPVPK